MSTTDETKGKSKTAPPPPPPSEAKATPAPTAQSKPAKPVVNQVEMLKRKFWQAVWGALLGLLYSTIWGTIGMAKIISDTETSSGIGAVTGFIAFLAVLGINANQFAKILHKGETSPRHDAEKLLNYLVDGLNTFTGPGGFTLLIGVFLAASVSEKVWSGAGAFFLFVLALGSAVYTEYAASDALKYLNLLNKKPAESGFKEIEIGALQLSATIGYLISVIAGTAGLYYLARDYAPGIGSASPLWIWLGGLAGTAAIQFWQTLLVANDDKSPFEHLMLYLLWTADWLLTFTGIGGVILLEWLFVNWGIGDPKVIALAAVAVLSKLALGYYSAVAPETAQKDVWELKHGTSTPTTETQTSDAPATQASPTSSTTAAAPSSSPAPAPKPNPAAASTPTPPANTLLKKEEFDEITDDDEIDVTAFWSKQYSPKWLLLAAVAEGKQPVPIGFVPFDWIPEEFRPKAPEPTYHPVGMDAPTAAPKKKTPPHPADQKDRYDA